MALGLLLLWVEMSTAQSKIKNWIEKQRHATYLNTLNGVTRWRRAAIVAVCVLADIATMGAMLLRFDERSGNSWDDRILTEAVIGTSVSILTWVLLAFALRHVPREFSVYERYPGPVSALVSAVIICASAGVHQLSLTVFVAYVSLVSRGSKRWTLVATAVLTLSYGVKVYKPDSFETVPMALFGYAFFWAVLVLSGLLIGVARHSRRQRQATLVARAELNKQTLEAENEKVRQDERNRIARDMHDSLSHRLSLISVYAGGLAYRKDLPPEQVAESATTIQKEAEQAVTDLRQVIRSLRIDDRIDPRTSIDDHVVRARAAGAKVTLEYRDDCLDKISTMGVHALSRAVQEGLTNARKHAPGQKIAIEVAQDGALARVTMRNRKVEGASASGGEHGLIGMRERARLVGGRLDVEDGEEFSWSLYLPMEER